MLSILFYLSEEFRREMKGYLSPNIEECNTIQAPGDLLSAHTLTIGRDNVSEVVVKEQSMDLSHFESWKPELESIVVNVSRSQAVSAHCSPRGIHTCVSAAQNELNDTMLSGSQNEQEESTAEGIDAKTDAFCDDALTGDNHPGLDRFRNVDMEQTPICFRKLVTCTIVKANDQFSQH